MSTTTCACRYIILYVYITFGAIPRDYLYITDRYIFYFFSYSSVPPNKIHFSCTGVLIHNMLVCIVVCIPSFRRPGTYSPNRLTMTMKENKTRNDFYIFFIIHKLAENGNCERYVFIKNIIY